MVFCEAISLWITVQILPAGLQQQAISQNHDIPAAGHQVLKRTLCQVAYWVNMVKDVEQYCIQLL